MRRSARAGPPAKGLPATGGTGDAVAPDAEWLATDWSSYTHTPSINGRAVNFVDIGSGPCVVLVHGQGGCWQWWLRILNPLSRRAG